MQYFPWLIIYKKRARKRGAPIGGHPVTFEMILLMSIIENLGKSYYSTYKLLKRSNYFSKFVKSQSKLNKYWSFM